MLSREEYIVLKKLIEYHDRPENCKYNFVDLKEDFFKSVRMDIADLNAVLKMLHDKGYIADVYFLDYGKHSVRIYDSGIYSCRRYWKKKFTYFAEKIITAFLGAFLGALFTSLLAMII